MIFFITSFIIIKISLLLKVSLLLKEINIINNKEIKYIKIQISVGRSSCECELSIICNLIFSNFSTIYYSFYVGMVRFEVAYIFQPPGYVS